MKQFLKVSMIFFLFTSSALASEPLRVMLDWFPNVDHLPVYVAQQQGWFAEADLDVEIVAPSDAADPLKLALAGQVDVAVSYEPQALIAASQDMDVKVFGRLVGSPLTCLFFLKDAVASPQELSGQKIGYTVPGMMDLLMKGFADLNGIKDYELVHVGYTILPALTTGQVKAIMGPFKTYEVVTSAHQGVEAAYFDLEQHGIPSYDELIFATGSQTWEHKADALRRFRDTIGKALAWMAEYPDEALELYFSALPDLDRVIETKAARATFPFFATTQELNPEQWQNFADFALKQSILEKAVDVSSVLRK